MDKSKAAINAAVVHKALKKASSHLPDAKPKYNVFVTQMHYGSKRVFLLGFLFGAIAGVYALASKSDQTRQELVDKVEYLKSTAHQKSDEVKSSVASKVDGVKSVATEVVSDTASKVKASADKVSARAEEVAQTGDHENDGTVVTLTDAQDVLDSTDSLSTKSF